LKFEGTFFFNKNKVFEVVKHDPDAFLLKNKDNFVSYSNDSNFEYKIFTRIVGRDSIEFEFCNFDTNLISNSDSEDIVSSSELDIGLFIAPDGTIKLSRNHFGTVPLFYIHIPDTFFSFSTSLSGLVQKVHVRDYLDVDLLRVSSYCTFMADSNHPYDDSTFYKHIKTILPGHFLSVNAKSVEIRPYLFFDTDQWNNLRDDSDYAQQLLIALKASVSKAAKQGNIASHLSGGMDSSAMSALTKLIFPEKSLHTLYADTDTDFNRESDYAKRVAEKIKSIHHEVKPALNDFELLVDLTAEYGHPECAGSSPALHTRLMSYAQSQGCTVLLNGFDGDTIIGTGYEYLFDLAAQKNWETLKEILLRRSKVVNLTYYYSEWNHASPERKFQLTAEHFLDYYMSGLRQKEGMWAMLQFYMRIINHFEMPCFHLFKKLYHRILRLNNNDMHINSILKPEYAYQNRVDQNSYSKMTNSTDPQTIDNISSIFKRLTIQNNETHFTLSNYYGIHNKMPMYDKAIVEICASTPNKVKYSNGFGRKHFRDAMANILPAKVNNRVDKGIFSLYAKESVLRLANQAQEFLTDHHEVWKYINREDYYKMKQILEQENQHVKTYNRPQFHVAKTISFAIWLTWLKQVKERSIS
jgi:asparagine synthase (glutamine-hydrolysing)